MFEIVYRVVYTKITGQLHQEFWRISYEICQKNQNLRKYKLQSIQQLNESDKHKIIRNQTKTEKIVEQFEVSDSVLFICLIQSL